MNFTLETPEVVTLMTGVFRGGIRTYYRTDETGKPYVYPLRRELTALGMCTKTATGLMQGVPFAPFVKASPSPEKPAKKCGPPPMMTEEREEREEKAEAAQNSKRYHLVRSGPYWGCFDGIDATQVLFTSREDAENYMWDLVHGRDGFKTFHSGGKRHD
jgi:hypothetical protein